MKKTLYLLDGYGLIYRSYFAFMHNPLFSPDGRNTSAVFGFFRAIISLFQEHGPTHFAVVLDSPVPTFRHERYPEYKANREKAPEDLHAQVPVIKEILQVMGIPFLQADRYEADDIMATLAAQCREQGDKCCLITSDKDLLQLVNDGEEQGAGELFPEERGEIKVLKPDKGGFIELGKKDVFTTWGVRADQILDYLSMTGDQADNIPGVKGIGPKTAAKLLGDYGTLDEIYLHLEDLSATIRKKFEEGKESAYLSRELITLETAVPVNVVLEDLSTEKVDLSAASSLFLREGMKSLVQAVGGREGGASITQTGEKAQRGTYEVVQTVEDLDRWIEKVKETKVYAFDTETNGLDVMVCEPVGFSLSVGNNEGCYIPRKVVDGNPLPEDTLKEKLRLVLEDPELSLVGQNIKFDYKVMKRWGIRMANMTFDTMIAAWLLDTMMKSYTMDSLAGHYLNYETIHFDDVVPKGDTFDMVPLEKAVDYAAEDADITFRLYEHFKPQLEERGLKKLFQEIEMPLIEILAEMELAGIGIIPETLTGYGEELTRDLKEIEEQVYELCGHEFNLNSTKQLQVVLFKERKLKPIKKTKTGYSTDVKVLEELSRDDPVPELILRNRSLAKLKSTYVDALPKMVNRETGRIHGHFIQTGTATGRLSSRDPNLQNIPIRDEAGRRIRNAFVPGEGHTLVSADYSQIELVILAHLSGDPELQHAFREGEDVHRRTGALIFGVPHEEVTSEQRRIAKTINFGVMYGMSAFRLANELKIPRTQAADFINAYFSRYAKIREFIDRTVEETEKSGKVSTLFGRERKIPGINSRNKTERMAAQRVAVNTPIQGSAADIVKVAMLKISDRIKREGIDARLVLQVHDELVFEVADGQVGSFTEVLRDEMENAVTLDVPLRVGIEAGACWGEFH